LDGKGSLYKIRYDFWASPSGDVLACVGNGTVASMPVSATWLYSKLSDGSCLSTTDNQAAMESDLSGMTRTALHTNPDCDALLAPPRRRFADAHLPVVPFAQQDPFRDFMAFRTDRVDRLADRGQARFLDDKKDTWRYTLKGAFAVSVGTYVEQLFAMFRN